MLAIYSNNYFTDEVIAHCNFPQDESYDNILDDIERWTAAFQQVEKLCSMDQETVYAQIQDTVEHNYQLLMHTNWNLLMYDSVKNVIDNLQSKIHKEIQ